MHILNDVFGRLTWDDRAGCWVGEVAWPPGRQTEVLVCHPGRDIAAGLRTAAANFDWLRDHDEDVKRYIADRLLHVYNAAWREEEVAVTEDEFIARLEPIQIVFGADGAMRLAYDGGEDMFGGQYIDAEFGPDGSFQGARLTE
jgi:hypothetical protein